MSTPAAPAPEREVARAVAEAPRGVAVALSGGLDSTLLAHLAASQGTVRLLHVNHHLGPAAEAMAGAAARTAAALGADYQELHVEVPQAARTSLEAAAREVRYRALAAALAAGETLLTAHHADDQAETVLLQLLRGSGPRGLKGLTERQPFAAGWLVRPLLAVPRTALEACAAARGIRFVDDPSNRSTVFDRNYLRHQVMPVLSGRWPGAVRALGRVAALQAACVEGLETEAARRLARADYDQRRLALTSLVGLSDAARRELLRAWLRRLAAPVPPAAALTRVLEVLVPYRGGGAPEVRFGGAALRRFREHLYLVPALGPFPAAPVTLAEAATGALPYGRLQAYRCDRGLRLREPVAGRLEVRFRRGGERLRVPGGRHRTLKRLLADSGVPPWERPLYPLVVSDEAIVAVPELYIAPGYEASGKAPGLRFIWERGWPGQTPGGRG